MAKYHGSTNQSPLLHNDLPDIVEYADPFLPNCLNVNFFPFVPSRIMNNNMISHYFQVRLLDFLFHHLKGNASDKQSSTCTIFPHTPLSLCTALKVMSSCLARDLSLDLFETERGVFCRESPLFRFRLNQSLTCVCCITFV